MRFATPSTIAVLATNALVTAAPSSKMQHGHFRSKALTSTPAKLLISNLGNIFLADYNPLNNSVTTVLDEAVSGLPSWTSFIPPSTIYAVDENSDTTRIFNVDIATNSITPGPTAQGSGGVVHFEFNPLKTRMVGAGYVSGKIDVWNIENGGLDLITTLVSNDPLGPNPSRQDAPHPHQTVLDPTGRYFIANDLGTDHLLVIDSQDDKWEITNHVQVTPGGVGPRHGVFYSANGSNTTQATHYILVCEMASAFVVFKLDYGADTLHFTQVLTVSTYGPGRGPANPSTAAAGEVVVNGDNLYVSNRLTGNATDSVAHFKIEKAASTSASDITLVYKEDVSSGGTTPRMFSISTDKTNLFLGNQAGADGLVVLPLSEDGTLGAATASVPQAAYGTQASYGPECVHQIA